MSDRLKIWLWKCAGCKVEVKTSVGQLPESCSCGAVQWDKIAEKNVEDAQ